MPPRKHGANAANSAPKPTRKKNRTSLATKLNLSGEEEEEIRGAFELFVAKDEYGDEVIETADVRKALRAMGFSLTSEEMEEIIGAVDAEETGFVNYEIFLEVCALKIHDRDKQEEIDKAYSLFTGGHDGPITIAHLRRVAKALNENITDDTLKDMLMEASTKDAGKVDKRDFADVMQRAGML